MKIETEIVFQETVDNSELSSHLVFIQKVNHRRLEGIQF